MINLWEAKWTLGNAERWRSCNQEHDCKVISINLYPQCVQGCIFRLTCSHPELTEDHVLTSAYVKIFRTVTRNAVNKSVWRKKDCSWLPLNKHAMNIWLSSLRIRAHLSWRTGKHLHVLHVLRTYPTCSYPGYQDTTTYAALGWEFSFSLRGAWLTDPEPCWPRRICNYYKSLNQIAKECDQLDISSTFRVA